MKKFYFLIWLQWSFYLTTRTVFLALLLSLMTTLLIYISRSMPELNSEVTMALYDIGKFWFTLFWSLALLIVLFRSIKYIFNSCHNGYTLELLSCPKDGKSEALEVIGYGDLVKVWRKWLMLLIWLIGAEMVLAVIITHFALSYNTLFSWFNIYVLYSFILIAGYFSFILLSVKCKTIRLQRC